MSKQRLSVRKERLCSEIGGKTYRACYTRGSREHFLAECWYGDGEPLVDCDWVNYKTREVSPRIRNGQSVERVVDVLVPAIIQRVHQIARDAMERRDDYAIVNDTTFDEYAAAIPAIARLTDGTVTQADHEHLMCKAIRIYPERANYPGG